MGCRRGPRETLERDGRNVLAVWCNNKAKRSSQELPLGRNYLVIDAINPTYALRSCFHKGRTTGVDMSLFPASPGALSSSLNGISTAPGPASLAHEAGWVGTARGSTGRRIRAAVAAWSLGMCCGRTRDKAHPLWAALPHSFSYPSPHMKQDALLPVGAERPSHIFACSQQHQNQGDQDQPSRGGLHCDF